MAGLIPQSFIDDLVSRADIVEIIDARVPLKKAGRDHKACCPFHDEKTPSFTVSPEKQFYHCFGCSAHGTAITFLMEYNHLSFVEAVEELATQQGLEVPREGGPGPAPVDRSLYSAVAEAARYYQRNLREHGAAPKAREYLQSRQLSGEVAQQFGIGYAPPSWDGLLNTLGKSPAQRQQLLQLGLVVQSEQGRVYDRFRDRIMFPIRDRRGRVIAFGGRLLQGDGPKYLNSPESDVFHKGRELYGLYHALQSEGRLNQIVVVEGYMDVVALAQYGIRHAVATLGTATTGDHLELLFRNATEVVFCFDGDRAGRQAAWHALENTLPVLRDGRHARFLFLPEGDDPDSLVRKEGRESFLERVALADSLSNFLLNALERRVDSASQDGQARLVDLALPYLRRIPAGGLRESLVGRLGRSSGLTDQQVQRLLDRQPSKRSTPAYQGRKSPAQPQTPSPVRRAISALNLKGDERSLNTSKSYTKRLQKLQNAGSRD